MLSHVVAIDVESDEYAVKFAYLGFAKLNWFSFIKEVRFNSATKEVVVLLHPASSVQCRTHRSDGVQSDLTIDHVPSASCWKYVA